MGCSGSIAACSGHSGGAQGKACWPLQHRLDLRQWCDQKLAKDTNYNGAFKVRSSETSPHHACSCQGHPTAPIGFLQFRMISTDIEPVTTFSTAFVRIVMYFLVCTFVANSISLTELG